MLLAPDYSPDFCCSDSSPVAVVTGALGRVLQLECPSNPLWEFRCGFGCGGCCAPGRILWATPSMLGIVREWRPLAASLGSAWFGELFSTDGGRAANTGAAAAGARYPGAGLRRRWREMAERRLRLLLALAALSAARSSESVIRRFTPFYFTVEPADTLAIRGSSVILNCSVFAEPKARIEWRKDGTFLNLISDERRQMLLEGSLLIHSVVHSKHHKPDEGFYQCVATIDSLGTIVSRTAKITVAGLPRFSGQPEAVSVHQGDTALLGCEVNADLVPFVRWEHNRQLMVLEGRFLKLPSGALEISNATNSDVGPYRCSVEIAGSSKTSEELELTVLPEMGTERQLKFLQQPVSISKVAGQSVILPCVVSGYPTPAIQWVHNDEIILERSHRMALVGSGSLQINDILEEDAGLYECIAEFGNETVNAQAELSVQVPPHFLKRPVSIYAHESMDIVFECEVTGIPMPTVKWIKNGDMVIPSDYFKIVNERNLQVLGLVKSDEGLYQCVAENDVGNKQASAQLIILEHDVPIPTFPPTSLTSATADHLATATAGLLPSAPRDVVALLVSTRFIKLAWRPPAEPNAEILAYSVYYAKDGANRERVENTSRPGDLEVTIGELMPDVKYVFRVIAHNKHGAGESSAPFKVATQPEVQVPGPAQNLFAQANSPTSITVTWQEPLSENGPIVNYKLYYMEKGAGSEQDVDVGSLSYTINGLKKFTEYSFRVVAYNKHGPGVSTEEIVATTYSGVPSAPPQNVTLEVRNSKSIVVHWQPPPPGTHNGVITGYNIRYKKAGRRGETDSTGGNQLSQVIDGLERNTEYSFRVSAITVNGTGPSSDWVSAETFESDLDESRVPDKPSSLHVRPLINHIVVSWTPPENQNIVVRGYTIGYGIGSPHAETIRVDYKQRYYTIENLEPNSHYVITLKAYNKVGEGIPLYESTATRPLTDPFDPSEVYLIDLFDNPYTPVPDPSPMMPPVGVQATVLTHDTIRVTWADSSLPKNQKITDARYYTVHWKTNYPANTKYKTADTTTLSYIVSGLKPNTLYEFSVKVTKGRRSSTWSMTAHGTTFETVPTSPPKDLTVVSKEGKPRTIIVNWQPPAEANGKITGYIIYYSTDIKAEIHDWVIEPVVGDRLTHQIQDLTLDTTYYFKIQARNSKGMGPLSDFVQFRTPKAPGSSGKVGKHPPMMDSGADTRHSIGGHNSPHGSPTSSLDSNIMLIIIISVGVFTIIMVVIIALICTRRTNYQQKKKRAACKSANGSHKYKGNSKDVKPPDLWIHHERLELKPNDKSPDPNPVMTDTPIPRNSQDITPVDSSVDKDHQRRNSYLGRELEDGVSSLSGRRGLRPKIMMPFDAHPPQPVISAHPIHSLDNPHHHHHCEGLSSPTRSYLRQTSNRPLGSSLDRASSTESVRNTPNSDMSPALSSQTHTVETLETDVPPVSYLPGSQEEESNRSVPTAHVRPSHPLKSFAVIAIPPTSTNYDAASSSTPLLAQTGTNPQVQSVKTASIGTLGRSRSPMAVTVPSAPDVAESTKMLEDSDANYGSDELTEEMAHLTGLMKDLNVITTA
ncbi:neogenin-like isoform X2 [Mobula hypostoma]|uniref:neogenin-like isoform X2 n=1 Tax=Mobula hypostoma TaxID=723540 RepID=UPI002FC2C238